MRRLEAKGTTIAYARTGAGPPFVLMHGAEADHSMFAWLSAQLDSRRTVIVCDQRDFRDSANPRQPSTFEDLGNDAAARIKKLSIEKAHVYGTSFGSPIAQLLAVHNPERADRVKNARRIARIRYPEAHPAAHPDVIEPLKFSAGPSNNTSDARSGSGRHLHSICLRSRRRRWCSPVVRTAWFRRLPKKSGGSGVNPGGRRVHQCDPGPARGHIIFRFLGVAWSGMKSIN